MAFVYADADIDPTKADLLAAWVPDQPWAGGVDGSGLTTLGAFRFDDPDGEVGIETHLLRGPDGTVLQVPLTYRGAPLDGGEQALITTMEHTALGRRWVYDGCGDPTYAAVLAATILCGGRQADIEFESGGRRHLRESAVQARGTGTDAAPAVSGQVTATRSDEAVTVMTMPEADLILRRRLRNDDPGSSDVPRLLATWPGQDEVVLALLRR